MKGSLLTTRSFNTLMHSWRVAQAMQLNAKVPLLFEELGLGVEFLIPKMADKTLKVRVTLDGDSRVIAIDFETKENEIWAEMLAGLLDLE